MAHTDEHNELSSATSEAISGAAGAAQPGGRGQVDPRHLLPTTSLACLEHAQELMDQMFQLEPGSEAWLRTSLQLRIAIKSARYLAGKGR